MDLFFILLGLLLLAFPIIAIVALVRSVVLGDQLRRGAERLATIERQLAAASPEPVQPAAPIAEPPAPVVEEPAEPAAVEPEPESAAPPPPASPPVPAAAAAAGRASLEERLGTRWTV